mgnify:CR=1 FL=1
MIEYKLGDLCTMQSGGTPRRGTADFYGGDIPWIKISDFKNNRTGTVLETEETITRKGLEAINNRLFPEGTLLLAMYGSVGKTAFAGIETSCNQAILGILPKDENILNLKYLKYWFEENKEKLVNQGRGVTLNNISATIVKKQKINLPDLPTQNKIVAILDKASSLVQKREDNIALLDELLRAQFLEMFGDPVLNIKKWESNKLSKLCNLERGRFSPRPRNDPSYFNGDFPFIQTGDISNSNYRLSEFTQTLNSKGIQVSKEFKAGTIVIAIVGATIGKTAILGINTYATDSIIGITPKRDLCNNYFIEMVLRFYKEYLIDKAPSAARANINLKILNKLDIISPSLDLQNKYEAFNHRIESQKEILSESKIKLENLYNSLLQRAFNGQLNFNADAELDVLLTAIDAEQEKNDIRDIATVYASRLLERLETQDFESKKQYQQAKQVAFQMLKEGTVKQEYDEKSKSVKLKHV